MFSSVMSRSVSPLFPCSVPRERDWPVTLRIVTSLTVRVGGGWPWRSKNWSQGLTFMTRPPLLASLMPSNVMCS